MKVGVVDSGIGGIKVLEGLQKDFKGEYLYLFDRSFMPYGDKNLSQIKDRVFICCDFLISNGADVIVLACNTASCCALEDCKSRYNIPILGLIPPVEILSNSKDNTLLLSTPLTANILNEKYNIKNSKNIILSPQKDLAYLIENHYRNKIKIKEYLINNLKPYANICSKVFLGCTHYYFVKNEIKNLLNIDVVDGRLQLLKEFDRINAKSNATNSKTTFYYL